MPDAADVIAYMQKWVWQKDQPYIQEVSLQGRRALRLRSSESLFLASSVTEKWLERGKAYVCVSVYIIPGMQVSKFGCVVRWLHQLFILFCKCNCLRGSLYCIYIYLLDWELMLSLWCVVLFA